MLRIRQALLVLAILLPATSLHSETRDEWIALGARVHGAFGPFIALGIRIGLDASKGLEPARRDLMVT